MSLDDKLKVILDSFGSEERDYERGGEISVLYLARDEAIAQIKQAFSDEYVFMKRGDSPFTMYTGQEWYDRFIRERIKEGSTEQTAAKRAAGLS